MRTASSRVSWCWCRTVIVAMIAIAAARQTRRPTIHASRPERLSSGEDAGVDVSGVFASWAGAAVNTGFVSMLSGWPPETGLPHLRQNRAFGLIVSPQEQSAIENQPRLLYLPAVVAAEICAPHLGQKRAAGSSSNEQVGHRLIGSGPAPVGPPCRTSIRTCLARSTKTTLDSARK